MVAVTATTAAMAETAELSKRAKTAKMGETAKMVVTAKTGLGWAVIFTILFLSDSSIYWYTCYT